MNKGFWQSGHKPTLFSAFLYFDMSFMVWVMLGPLGVHIASDLNLSPSEKGLMVAIPVLFGALLRVPIGMMVDSLGPKRTGQIGQVIVIASLLWAWMGGVHNLGSIYAMGVLLGVAGASFAVALPLASLWYPPQFQGIALGIVGAVIIGPPSAALFAPKLSDMFGWSAVFGLALIPMVLVLVLFTLMAKDSPEKRPPLSIIQYFKVMKDPDTWWFMFFYAVTFGGFVGLASSLVIYFNDEYGLSPSVAGYFTAACIFSGSVFRPIGGLVADRIGGVRVLTILYGIIAASMAAISFTPSSKWVALTLFVIGMMAMGMGNGSVFQLVPQRFRKEIGVMTGLVGMAGGVGGFWLASSLGFSKGATDSYQIGFLIFAALGLLAMVGITGVKKRWRTTWGSAESTSARI